MRPSFRFALVSALALGPLAAPTVAQEASTDPPRPTNYIVATVNGESITYDDVMRSVRKSFRKIDENRQPPERQIADKTAQWTNELRLQADAILGAQEAARLGIKATKAEVEEYYQRRIKGLGGLDSARKSADERGFTLAELWKLYERNITLERLIHAKIGIGRHDDSAVRPDYDMYVSPAELRRYYDVHHAEFASAETVMLRWILVPRTSDAVADLARANGIAMLLSKGADFIAVTRAFSRPDVAQRDGKYSLLPGMGDAPASDEPEWGPVEASRIEPAVREVALATPIGEVSKPVVATSGVAIVRVEARTVAGTRSFEEAQGSIRQRIREDRYAENAERVLGDLRRAAKVVPANLFSAEQDLSAPRVPSKTPEPLKPQ